MWPYLKKEDIFESWWEGFMGSYWENGINLGLIVNL